MTAEIFRYINKFKVIKRALILALISLSISCSDQGCIDADDFGEYESETIEVNSNTSQDNCKYDAGADLTDTGAQGSNVVTCFSTSSGPFIDEQGVEYTSSSGCVGLQEQGAGTAMDICIDQCVQSCNLNMASSGDTSEPNWQSTNKRASNMNYGVTIRPGSEIYIRAIGNVTLGDQAANPDVYVGSQSFLPESFDQNWDHRALDVRGQQSLNIDFSGLMRLTNGSNDIIGAGSTKISVFGNTAADTQIYRGVRRLITYLIPHPASYDFDSAATSEESGSINVPLLADSLAWGCIFTGSDQLEANCKSLDDGYTSIGYTNVDDSLAEATFPISSEYQTSGLGTYGGIIRWKDDVIGLMNSNYDPFVTAGVTCTTSSCDTSSVPSFEGRMVGDLTTSSTIVNPTQERAYKVSFRSLDSNLNSACNIEFKDQFSGIKIEYSVLDENDVPVHQFESALNNNLALDISEAILTGDGSWSTDHVTLEPGHKIVIGNTNLVDATCGQYIAVKFIPYHEIEIHRSGVAKFAILDSISGSCNIDARIINPEGSHSFETFFPNNINNATYAPDFYEYGSFSDSGDDPLENKSITSSWSSKIYLRKGQKIRFAPKSWNDDFTTSAGVRKCGTAMAMSLTPKPALLCRGKSTAGNQELVINPLCLRDYTTNTFSYADPNDADTSIDVALGEFIGCKDSQPECDDPTHNNYCPVQCKAAIVCAEYGNEDNNYTKSDCSAGEASDIEGADGSVISCDDQQYDYSSCTTQDYEDGLTNNCRIEINYDSACNQCENLRIDDSEIAGKIGLTDMDKCYDLENYKGKVSNISSTEGFLDSDLADPEISKGASVIPYFNGTYGNFEANFYEKDEVDDVNGDNSILSISAPLFFSKSGRLRFYVLDDNVDFNDPNGAIDNTGDNTNTGNSYSGSNGFKISTSGMLSFSNGQWLEVALCQESSNSSSSPSVDCKTSGTIGNVTFTSNPSPTDQQANIVRVDDATSTPSTQRTHADSKYKFDDYGNLVRTSSAVSGDCSIGSHGVDTLAGNYFYCHTYQYNTLDDFEDLSNSAQEDVTTDLEKLRLSFKIYDPEEGNCRLLNGSRTANVKDGVIVDNNYYDGEESSNINMVCNDNAGEIPGFASGECQKQYICANKYSNNSGSYLVNIKVKSEVTSGISNVIGEVIEPIIKVMDGPKRNCSTGGGENALFFDGYRKTDDDVCEIASVGQAERIYKLLINDSRYQLILNSAIVLMFTFFGMTYLMGVSELSQSEIISRVIKIGVIYLFVSPTGWDWFNSLFVRFFKGGSDHLAFLMASSFDSSPELQNAITNSDYYDKAILFGSVDRVFGIFFSDAVLKKISALLFASIFGWAYLLIVIMSFVLYVYAVANAVLLYLTAQIFMSILFTLGPIFFIFILFNQTKEMFDNWLKQLIGFSLQQILILTTLAFFNMLMYEVIKMALGYKICWDEVWTINIITRISLLSFWTIASLPPVSNSQLQVGNIGNPDGIPSIFTILFIWVIASLMNKFVGFMSSVAADISGGISASDLSSGVGQAVGQAKQMAGKAASSAWQKTGGKEAMERLDMAVFDSGKAADRNRDKLNRDNKNNSQRKSKLEKGGQEAVEKFKKENTSLLNNMSEEKRAETLDKEREKGINKTGTNMGLNKEEIKKLKDQKGLQSYHGSNVFGAAAQFGRQAVGGAISGDSTIRKSMGDKKADTSFSAKTFEEGAKNMTKEQRAEMKDKDKGGINLDVKRSTTGKMLKAGKDAKTKIENLSLAGMKESVSNAVSAVADGGTKAMNSTVDAGKTAVSKAGKAGSNVTRSLGRKSKALRENKENKSPEEINELAQKEREEARRDAVGSVGRNIASAVTAPARAADAMLRSKGEKEATKQLEEEGKINKMADGTNLARPDGEKKAIEKRAAENKKQTSAGKMKDIGGAMDAKLELDYQTAHDDLNEKEKDKDGKDTNIDKLSPSEKRSAKISAANKRYNPDNPEKDNIRTNEENRYDEGADKEIANSREDISNSYTGLSNSQNKIEKAKAIKKGGVKKDEKGKEIKLTAEDNEKLDKTINEESGNIQRGHSEIENSKKKIENLEKSKFNNPKKADPVDENASENTGVEVVGAEEESTTERTDAVLPAGQQNAQKLLADRLATRRNEKAEGKGDNVISTDSIEISMGEEEQGEGGGEEEEEGRQDAITDVATAHATSSIMAGVMNAAAKQSASAATPPQPAAESGAGSEDNQDAIATLEEDQARFETLKDDYAASQPTPPVPQAIQGNLATLKAKGPRVRSQNESASTPSSPTTEVSPQVEDSAGAGQMDSQQNEDVVDNTDAASTSTTSTGAGSQSHQDLQARIAKDNPGNKSRIANALAKVDSNNSPARTTNTSTKTDPNA